MSANHFPDRTGQRCVGMHIILPLRSENSHAALRASRLKTVPYPLVSSPSPQFCMAQTYYGPGPIH